MKKISTIFLCIFFLNAGNNDIPEWVPEKHRATFSELIDTIKELQETSKEYSDTLNAKPIIVKCDIKDNEVVFEIKRNKIRDRVRVMYDAIPISCEITPRGDAIIIFDAENLSTWEKIKDWTIKIIIGLGVGFFLGKSM